MILILSVICKLCGHATFQFVFEFPCQQQRQHTTKAPPRLEKRLVFYYYYYFGDLLISKTNGNHLANRINTLKPETLCNKIKVMKLLQKESLQKCTGKFKLNANNIMRVI